MTVLVTGANGRPGAAVIREFARRGDPVRALVRDPARAGELAELPGVRIAVGDMLWPESLENALDGVDRVLMISGAGPLMLETQVTFIDAARKAGIGHIVKLGGDEGPRWDSEKFRSTRSHEQIQRYLLASGVPWTILRPSQFMEVYFEEIPDIVEHGELRLPLGDATLAPITVDDIAKIAHAVLTTDGHEYTTYRMTGPRAISMTEAAADISAAIGRPVRYVDVSPAEKRRQWIEKGYPPPRADAFVQLFEERRRLGSAHVDRTTHQRFGIAPTTFGEFAARHAEVFRGSATYQVTPG
ncbi:SDR family oxidoreductase [Nocardia aurantia]|uniref:NAD(P)H azoreductase n=1 Tax=Nocardia aurantia TaxID=2585199 RepID=A0A7K0DT20_9NOCA|nr:SDR family oxidoreductase [Nocardia aurantia]MQY28876.1 NAD(P)H azoreductase [Nocardia aurantia]